MRYALVDTISFTAVNGVSRAVKEMREIPEYELMRTLGKTAREKPDEVITKDEAFGSGSEWNSFRLWEANVVALADVGFDWARIRKVRIPQ